MAGTEGRSRTQQTSDASSGLCYGTPKHGWARLPVGALQIEPEFGNQTDDSGMGKGGGNDDQPPEIFPQKGIG